jgi:hypothetical protein
MKGNVDALSCGCAELWMTTVEDKEQRLAPFTAMAGNGDGDSRLDTERATRTMIVEYDSLSRKGMSGKNYDWHTVQITSQLILRPVRTVFTSR